MVRPFLILWCAGLFTTLSGRTIPVSSGDNLANKIAGAVGGDTVLVGSGTYGGFTLQNRTFTRNAPLIIRAAPGATPLLSTGNWYLVQITGCSYVVIDGLTTDGAGQPFYCTDVDHLILANLEVRNTGQEAVHIRGTSAYVDILRCHIHHTGSSAPQWAEGIYLGSGNTPFMNTDYVWIEGNEINNTGNSEAINIKSQSYHITVRNNRIHDIAPGTATQYNQSALSCEALDYSFRPGADPDIWIENNEIYNVTYGQWANGMQLTSMGSRVKNNHIHDCRQNCIFFNNYVAGSSPFTNYLFNNTLEGCGQGDYNTTSTLPISYTDPGTNPNQPQDWYRSLVSAEHVPTPRAAFPATGQIVTCSVYDIQGRTVTRFKGEWPGKREFGLYFSEIGRGQPNGLYLARITGGGQPLTLTKLVAR